MAQQDDFMNALKKAKIIKKDGTQLNVSDITGKDKYVGLYFSAHWCPPCRNFTPRLVQFYNQKKSEGSALEVIFVSYDRDEKSFQDYYNEMPWTAVSYEDTEAKELLGQLAGVRGIPQFTLLDEQGHLHIKNARSKVIEAPGQFPWEKE